MRLKEYLKDCDRVYHATLDPKSSGVVRIHLVPPEKPKPQIPWLVILNGYSVLPLESAWAVLLKEFLEALNKRGNKPLDEGEIDETVKETLAAVKKLFPSVPLKMLRADFGNIVKTLREIAAGNEPPVFIGYKTLASYAKYMSAPHRMDLMVTPASKNGRWNCNLKCAFCYCAGEPTADASYELSTDEWKKIIDYCRYARIPALTFTGGEPTLRKDLPELIAYAEWFVTRLNTNGLLLTEELCKKFYDASLDSVQITLYSADPEIHNALVGADGFEKTVQGIKNAKAAGLDVSINTPLCYLNRDYLKTIEFAMSLGVRYFSCSGLIPSGGALKKREDMRALTKDEITEIVISAKKFAYVKDFAEISFTSPGWIDEQVLKKNGMVVPACGACLSNMAIAPNGDVIPCQSWLDGEILGNMLTDTWRSIWNGELCKSIRKRACESKNTCLLKNENK